jgi:hypothetical protein
LTHGPRKERDRRRRVGDEQAQPELPEDSALLRSTFGRFVVHAFAADFGKSRGNAVANMEDRGPEFHPDPLLPGVCFEIGSPVRAAFTTALIALLVTAAKSLASRRAM